MKRKSPEDSQTFVARLTGQAVLNLGKGLSFRDIVSAIVFETLAWRIAWDEHDKKEKQ